MATQEHDVTLVCEGKPGCDGRARATITEHERLLVDPSSGQPVPFGRKTVTLPDGWTESRRLPQGKPILVAAGTSQVDLRDAASVATGTQVPQTIWCCPSCSNERKSNERARSVVEGAGLVVTGGT